MNHGIADAHVLMKELTKANNGEQSWPQAVDAYQTEMIKRAGDEVALSLVNTEMLHDWERFQDSPIMKVGGHALPAKK
jgi:2-polyprenyl-6-methoxyphenol hydroxylase-like FAD-dependent oxidoreductase